LLYFGVIFDFTIAPIYKEVMVGITHL